MAAMLSGPQRVNAICIYNDRMLNCFVADWRHMSSFLINIGLGNALLADGAKPLHEPMSTYHPRLLWRQIGDIINSKTK